MLKIRLQRRGRKKLPIYKMVIADSRAPRDGRFLEAVGQYIAYKEPAVLTIDEARILYWLQKGAQPTDTVRNLISTQGVMLRLHLMRKGKTDEEIATELAAWRLDQEAKKFHKISAGKQAKKPTGAAGARPIAAEATAVETPITETPADEASAVEASIVEAPAAEAPTPVEEQPAE